MAIRKPTRTPRARHKSPPKNAGPNIDTHTMSPADLAELKVRTLATLRLNNYNVAETARACKLRKETLRRWVKADTEAARRVAEEKEKNDKFELERKWRIVNERKDKEREAQDDANNKATKQVITLSLEKMAQLCNEIVDSLRQELTPDAKPQKFYDRAWAFGVVFDKLQVAQGNPTSIHGRTEHHGMSRHQRLEQLLDTAAERQAKIRLLGNNEQEKDVAKIR